MTIPCISSSVKSAREGDAEAAEAVEEGICGDLQAKAKCYFFFLLILTIGTLGYSFAIWGNEK